MQTGTFQGWPTGPRSTVTVTGSPFVWRNDEAVPITLFISGGTVTSIEYSRDAVTWDFVGLLAGQVKSLPGDSVRITYVLAPTVAAYPL